ncbi:hypothetical protein AA21291_1908 [Swaminathania salitolerans LMG 21291]|uniref:Uncharacterized protein n=1 Tax=Swaminathania salitolerans TaxID=182838 RepID=A0A511BNC3_9PROT|nr:hypothetical protein AA21291_1908 [Swaminathania salitolerans LMG 21291]GEL01839.1 hypothetical protein SSA02_10020 [Swaminathania salitolerans]
MKTPSLILEHGLETGHPARCRAVPKPTDCEPVITTGQDKVEPPKSQSEQGFCKVGLSLTHNPMFALSWLLRRLRLTPVPTL